MGPGASSDLGADGPGWRGARGQASPAHNADLSGSCGAQLCATELGARQDAPALSASSWSPAWPCPSQLWDPSSLLRRGDEVMLARGHRVIVRLVEHARA